MVKYTVKQLAKIAGVSVRTLHLYDRLGLLKPSLRTEAKYRLYGEKELLRLQQVLLYKELDFPLEEIRRILDDPKFDLFEAFAIHKAALQTRKNRLETLLQTIDKTMLDLKNKNMLNHEDLYEGLSKETAGTYRKAAIDAYGEDAINNAEQHLLKMGKRNFEQLKAEQQEIAAAIMAKMHLSPESVSVQALIFRHYENIRQFWGTAHSDDPQAEAYKGLGELYLTDERYTTIDGKSNLAYAQFLSKAMTYFVENQLQ